MILDLNIKESSALVLHMAIMRKSFRNLIKAKYKERKSDFFDSYDYVHSEVKKSLILLENEKDGSFILHLNKIDLEVLEAFLKAYTNKVSAEMGNQLQGADKEQIEVLESLQMKCSELMVAV